MITDPVPETHVRERLFQEARLMRDVASQPRTRIEERIILLDAASAIAVRLSELAVSHAPGKSASA